MSLYDNAHIPAIGVQSETCFIKETVVDEYKFRFDRVITLFDSDEQGEQQADSYHKFYNISPIFIPKQYVAKDFSDLVARIGKKSAKDVLSELIEIPF